MAPVAKMETRDITAHTITSTEELIVREIQPASMSHTNGELHFTLGN